MIYYAGQFLTLPFREQEKQGHMGKERIIFELFVNIMGKRARIYTPLTLTNTLEFLIYGRIRLLPERVVQNGQVFDEELLVA